VSCERDSGQRFVSRSPETLERQQSISIGQRKVKQHHVDVVLRAKLYGFVDSRRNFHAVAAFLKQ